MWADASGMANLSTGEIGATKWIRLRIRLDGAESDASPNAELSANADSSAFLDRAKCNRINTLVWLLYCKQECEIEEINLYGE
jgi:hypothetical protein